MYSIMSLRGFVCCQTTATNFPFKINNIQTKRNVPILAIELAWTICGQLTVLGHYSTHHTIQFPEKQIQKKFRNFQLSFLFPEKIKINSFSQFSVLALLQVGQL